MQIFEHSPWFTEQVYPETITATQKNLYLSALGNIVLALMSVWLLYADVPARILWTWLALNLSITAIRVFAAKRLSPGLDSVSIRSDILFYVLSIFSLGLSWGALSIIASVYSTTIPHLFITIIIAGISAGAIATISPIFIAFKGYFTLAVFPVFISLLISPNTLIQQASPVVLFYIFLIYSSGKQLHQTLLKTIDLKTQQEQLNYNLLLETARTELANQSKNRFLSSMSHELRTPLNSVIGFADLLEADCEKEEQKEMLNIIKTCGYHLLSLINTILDWAGAESGQLEVNLSAVNLNELITELSATSHVELTQLNLSLDIVYPNDSIYWVLADAQRLKQVLRHLIHHAAQYNKAEGYIQLSVAEEDKTIDLIIHSSTQNEENWTLNILSSEFDSIDNIDGIKSSGIELLLAKDLIGLMGGQISVNQNNGYETQLNISLNRALDASSDS